MDRVRVTAPAQRGCWRVGTGGALLLYRSFFGQWGSSGREWPRGTGVRIIVAHISTQVIYRGRDEWEGRAATGKAPVRLCAELERPALATGSACLTLGFLSVRDDNGPLTIPAPSWIQYPRSHPPHPTPPPPPPSQPPIPPLLKRKHFGPKQLYAQMCSARGTLH